MISLVNSSGSAGSGSAGSGSSGSPGDDPVPREVGGVIELFATELAKVAFPEIDAGSLRRQADELRAEAKVVARAREALDAALASLAARRVALGEIAARAIAYARIYSQAHPDRAALATALAALSAPGSPEIADPAGAATGAAGTATGKRRGRPPRRSAELFDPQPAEAPPADPAPAAAAGSPRVS
jgi:ABC-type transporter Mla subunit MlaD